MLQKIIDYLYSLNKNDLSILVPLEGICLGAVIALTALIADFDENIALILIAGLLLIMSAMIVIPAIIFDNQHDQKKFNTYYQENPYCLEISKKCHDRRTLPEDGQLKDRNFTRKDLTTLNKHKLDTDESKILNKILLADKHVCNGKFLSNDYCLLFPNEGDLYRHFYRNKSYDFTRNYGNCYGYWQAKLLESVNELKTNINDIDRDIRKYCETDYVHEKSYFSSPEHNYVIAHTRLFDQAWEFFAYINTIIYLSNINFPFANFTIEKECAVLLNDSKFASDVAYLTQVVGDEDFAKLNLFERHSEQNPSTLTDKQIDDQMLNTKTAKEVEQSLNDLNQKFVKLILLLLNVAKQNKQALSKYIEDNNFINLMNNEQKKHYYDNLTEAKQKLNL